MVNVTVQSKGKKRVVKVDKGDYDKYAKGLSLSLLYTQGHAYARIDRNRLLHRVIKKAPPGLVVHHKNNNRLDNRRGNLELMTHSHNVAQQARYKRLRGGRLERRIR
ncbi:g10907 [Coccomyxa elongata]